MLFPLTSFAYHHVCEAVKGRQDKPRDWISLCLLLFQEARRTRDSTVRVGHSSSLFSTTHSTKTKARAEKAKRRAEDRKTEIELASSESLNLYIQHHGRQ